MVIFIKRRKRTNETLFWWLGAARRRVKGKRGMSNETHWTVPPPTRAPPPPPSSLKLTPMLALAAGLVADMRSLGQVIRGFGYVEPRNGRREQFYIPLNPPPPPPLFHNHEYRVSVRGKPFTNSCQHFNMLNSLQHRMASNDKISFLGKFALAAFVRSDLEAACTYVHLSRQSKRMELPWKFWRFKRFIQWIAISLSLSLSFSTRRRGDQPGRNILQISRVYRRLSNCSRSKLSCPAEIWSKPRDEGGGGRTDYYPSGFRERKRERDGRGESGLHCYYNETRINTSRLYTRDRRNYLLMMIFVEGEARRAGGRGDGGRVGGSQQQQQPPPPQFARPSDKLSEIMSEEIGSLARGWLTAGLPASSFSPSPFTLQPSPPFSQATFHGITHTSFPSDVSLRIDLYTTISSRTFFLFLSAFFPSSSFPSSLSQHFCFQASTRFTPFGIRVYYFCHSRGICCLNFALFFLFQLKVAILFYESSSFDFFFSFG